MENIHNIVKKDFESNSYYMGLIQNLYSGANGCVFALLQFLYQLNLRQNFPQFEGCFLALFENEFENCRLLGDMLFEMHADPQFFSSSRRYLNAHSINYVKDLDKIFLSDIEFLEINIIDLKSTILKIENENLKGKLKKILENKKKSLKFLKENYFKNQIVE